MTELAIAAVTIAAWGTWLAPAYRVSVASPVVVVFYASLANLGLAAIVAITGQHPVSFDLVDSAPAVGAGAIWALGGICAFSATEKLGTARAMGVWSPLNILLSLVLGGLLFREFADVSMVGLLITATSATLLIGGLLLIIRSSRGGPDRTARAGYLWAASTGVLWGSYFIPLQLAGMSPTIAALPMACGILACTSAFIAVRRISIRVGSGFAVSRLLATGLLWGAGNYASLALMDRIGTGRGFSIAQLCLVTNALVGIFALGSPAPGTTAARSTIAGCILATLGGALLGLSR